jgi:hypothetical protein
MERRVWLGGLYNIHVTEELIVQFFEPLKVAAFQVQIDGLLTCLSLSLSLSR